MLSGLGLRVSHHQTAGSMDPVAVPPLRGTMEHPLHHHGVPTNPLVEDFNSPSRQRPNHSIDAILGIRRADAAAEKQRAVNQPQSTNCHHHRLRSTSPTVSPCTPLSDNLGENTGHESNFSEEGCKTHTNGLYTFFVSLNFENFIRPNLFI